MLKEEFLSALPAIKPLADPKDLAVRLGVARIELEEGPFKNLLSKEEQNQYTGFSVEKRRREWLAGRLLAKKIVRSYIKEQVPYHDISILNGENRCPFVRIEGGWESMNLPDFLISISHRKEYVFCAIGKKDSIKGLGIDVELIEKRNDSFINDYFTSKEKGYIEKSDNPIRDITAIWSLKEAALKAMKVGLTVPAKSVEVDFSNYTVKATESGLVMQCGLSFHEPYVFSTAVVV